MANQDHGGFALPISSPEMAGDLPGLEEDGDEYVLKGEGTYVGSVSSGKLGGCALFVLPDGGIIAHNPVGKWAVKLEIPELPVEKGEPVETD